MSEQDYKAGMRGDPWSPAMNREDFDAGASVHTAKERILGAGSGPKTEVSGPGFTMILAAPLLAIMYPVASLTAMLGTAILYAPLHFLPSSLNIAKFLVLLVGFIWILIRALDFEHKASELKAYRTFRQIFRIAILGQPTIAMLFLTNEPNTSAQAFNEQVGGAIFFGFVGIALMIWIFPKLDRVFFPVMDDKAIAEAQQFAGMDEQEIWNVKNLRWRNRKRFFFIWLALSIVLAVIFRTGVPAVLIFGGAWIVVYALRHTFEIKE